MEPNSLVILKRHGSPLSQSPEKCKKNCIGGASEEVKPQDNVEIIKDSEKINENCNISEDVECIFICAHEKTQQDTVNTFEELVEMDLKPDIRLNQTDDEKTDEIIFNNDVEDSRADENLVDQIETEENQTEELCDEDLIMLIEHFEDLQFIEQQNLVSYLERLEKSDPSHVRKLEKCIKITFH